METGRIDASRTGKGSGRHVTALSVIERAADSVLEGI